MESDLYEVHDGDWYEEQRGAEYVKQGDGHKGNVGGQHVVRGNQHIGQETQQCHLQQEGQRVFNLATKLGKKSLFKNVIDKR